MTCQNCGSPIQPEDQFCGSCGAVVLPPAPQAEQVIPRQQAATQGATRGNARRLILLAGAVSVVLLLLIGGSAMALLGYGGEQVELISEVSSEVPKEWAIDTLSDDGGGVSLVPEGYEGQEVESFMDSDTKAWSEEAYISAFEDEDCDTGPPSIGKGGREDYIASGYDIVTNMSGSMEKGEATISGNSATWGVNYSARSMPWLMPGSSISKPRPTTADYPNYFNDVSLNVCVEDLNMSLNMQLAAYLSESSSEAPEDKPTSSRNATVPEAREEVHEELRQRYEANVGAMIDLLNSIDTDGWGGDTDLSEIPTSLDEIDQQLSDPFKGQLKDRAKAGTTKEKTSPSPKGKTVPKKDESPQNKKAGAGKETTQRSPNSGTNVSEAKAEEAAGDYYLKAGNQDWDYTYDNLDSQTKRGFTREEWRRKNQWFADNGKLIYSIDSVSLDESSQIPLAEVAVRLTGEDGSSSIRNTYFVYEDGEWKHRFGQEEEDLFEPGMPFEEWVEAQGGSTSGDAQEQQNVPSSEELFPEDDSGDKGEEI